MMTELSFLDDILTLTLIKNIYFHKDKNIRTNKKYCIKNACDLFNLNKTENPDFRLDMNK